MQEVLPGVWQAPCITQGKHGLSLSQPAAVGQAVELGWHELPRADVLPGDSCELPIKVQPAALLQAARAHFAARGPGILLEVCIAWGSASLAALKSRLPWLHVAVRCLRVHQDEVAGESCDGRGHALVRRWSRGAV